MQISDLRFIKNKIIYLDKKNKVTEKICSLVKKILDYFVYNKHAITMASWSYLLIEAGVTAAESNLGDNYIYDMESCQKVLCRYWNNNSNLLQTPTMPYFFEEKCHPLKKAIQPYSFMQCLTDLCNYTNSIGKELPTCSDDLTRINLATIEEKASSSTWKLWKKTCPIRHFKHLRNLKQLSYFNDCIKKLCRAVNEFPLDTEFIELCRTKSIDQLYSLLKEINKSVRKLKKSSGVDSSAVINNIAGLIGALTGIVSGVSGIATLYITYRATKAASTVISRAIPSLNEGIENIARTTIDTTMNAIRESTSHLGELISMESIQVIKDLAETLERQTSAQSLENPPIRSETSQLSDTVAVEGAGTLVKAGVGGVVAGSAVVGMVSITSKKKLELPIEIEKEKNTFAPFFEEPQQLSGTVDRNCFYDEHSVTLNPYDITIQSIECLKNSLPQWNNSFCFYQKSIDFFTCRLPSLRHQLEEKINFFAREIHAFFSENTSALCYSSLEDVWCDWNRFLDLLFSNRTITYFNDEECPWDQFSLKIYEAAIDTYKMQATGQCYNETEWLKV